MEKNRDESGLITGSSVNKFYVWLLFIRESVRKNQTLNFFTKPSIIDPDSSPFFSVEKAPVRDNSLVYGTHFVIYTEKNICLKLPNYLETLDKF